MYNDDCLRRGTVQKRKDSQMTYCDLDKFKNAEILSTLDHCRHMHIFPGRAHHASWSEVQSQPWTNWLVTFIRHLGLWLALSIASAEHKLGQARHHVVAIPSCVLFCVRVQQEGSAKKWSKRRANSAQARGQDFFALRDETLWVFRASIVYRVSTHCCLTVTKYRLLCARKIWVTNLLSFPVLNVDPFCPKRTLVIHDAYIIHKSSTLSPDQSPTRVRILSIYGKGCSELWCRGIWAMLTIPLVPFRLIQGTDGFTVILSISLNFWTFFDTNSRERYWAHENVFRSQKIIKY